MKTIFFLILCMVLPLFGYAQDTPAKDSDFDADLGADVVSNYMWRGATVDASPNLQGWGQVEYKSLTLGGWASVNYTGTYTETDLYLIFNYGNFSFSFTDYYGASDDYYNFNNEKTAHVDEFGASYTFGQNFPLQLTGAVILFGDDKKVQSYQDGEPVFSDENNYSSYFELLYPIKINKTTISFTTGFATHKSEYYKTDGFAFINLAIGFSKKIDINEKFSVPIGFAIVNNPDAKTINTVFKVSF